MSDVPATAAPAARFDSSATRARRRAPSQLPLWLAGLVLAVNVAAIAWLWWHGGNVTHVRTTGDLLVGIARLTGLLGALSALVQVLLLARIPWIERSVGF